jgi:hypothetical protein
MVFIELSGRVKPRWHSYRTASALFVPVRMVRRRQCANRWKAECAAMHSEWEASLRRARSHDRTHPQLGELPPRVILTRRCCGHRSRLLTYTNLRIDRSTTAQSRRAMDMVFHC